MRRTQTEEDYQESSTDDDSSSEYDSNEYHKQRAGKSKTTVSSQASSGEQSIVDSSDESFDSSRDADDGKQPIMDKPGKCKGERIFIDPSDADSTEELGGVKGSKSKKAADDSFSDDDSYHDYHDYRKTHGEKSRTKINHPASGKQSYVGSGDDSFDCSLDSDDDEKFSIHNRGPYKSKKMFVAPNLGAHKSSKDKKTKRDGSLGAHGSNSSHRNDNLSINLKQKDIEGSDEWRKTLNKRTMIIILVFGFLLVAIVVPICIINMVEMLKIFNLESLPKHNKDSTRISINNRINTLETVLNSTKKAINDKIFALKNRVESNQNVRTFRKKINSVEAKINRVNVLLREAASKNPLILSSCAQIQERDSTSTSGYYVIKLSTGQLRSVYCEMERCGEGGWTRVANLDVDNCPAGFKSKQFGSISTCVTVKDKANCSPIIYSTLGIRHSRVCGKVRAYADGTPDSHSKSHSNNMNQNYLDGISITSNSEHVWSFFVGLCDACEDHFGLDLLSSADWGCDLDANCNFQMGVFCKTLLFSSQRCGSTLQMFHKNVEPSNNDLKVRVCRDQSRADEDIAIKTIDLYIL